MTKILITLPVFMIFDAPKPFHQLSAMLSTTALSTLFLPSGVNASLQEVHSIL